MVHAMVQIHMTTTKLISSFGILLAVALAGSACGKKDEGGDKKTDESAKNADQKKTDPAATGTTGAAAVAEARKTFDTLCSVCHGASGLGDGIGAAQLNPKPRNYTDKEWQASVTDDDLRKVIIGGGPAVGKSATMAANPTLGKPDKAEVLNELIKIIRAFGK